MKDNYAMVVGHLRRKRMDGIAQMEDPRIILTLSEANDILTLLTRYREGLERIGCGDFDVPSCDADMILESAMDLARKTIGESDD